MLAWSCSFVLELHEEIFLIKQAGRRWTRDWVLVRKFASLPIHFCLVYLLPNVSLSFLRSLLFGLSVFSTVSFII